MSRSGPKQTRVGALSFLQVIPDQERRSIDKRIATAHAQGRSRVFVHAAIISNDIKVVIKHPDELETVMGSEETKAGENDDIIDDKELSRLTLRYENVYRNFHHVKMHLAEKRIAHYVIRRKLSVSEFTLIQYEGEESIVVERRGRSFLERILGDGKPGYLPVTALFVVADFFMPFASDSPVTSPRRTRSQTTGVPSLKLKTAMYNIDLANDARPVRGAQTERPPRARVMSVNRDHPVMMRPITITRHDSSSSIPSKHLSAEMTRVQSSIDIRRSQT